MFYFAYGSCMNEQDFLRTVTHYRRLGKAVVHGYRVAFTLLSYSRQGGVADMVAAIDEWVEGILYEINEEGLTSLDDREGHPTTYKRISITVVHDGYTVPDVHTYVVVNRSENEFAPHEHYAHLILEGGKDDLSDSYITRLKHHIETLRARA